MNPLDYLQSAPWLALVLCVVWSFAVGFTWYSRKLFGNYWIDMTGLKLSEDQMKSGMGRAFALEAISSLLLAFVLSFLASIADITNLEDYLWLGIIVTAGFGFKGFLSRSAWEQSNLNLAWLNGGALLVTILGMCIILFKMS